jgi:IS5 family transposase
MFRVHPMQNWFALSEPAMEEALYEIASLRTFAGLGLESIPDETTIMNYRHLLKPVIWPRTSSSRSTPTWPRRGCF